MEHLRTQHVTIKQCLVLLDCYMTATDGTTSDQKNTPPPPICLGQVTFIGTDCHDIHIMIGHDTIITIHVHVLLAQRKIANGGWAGGFSTGQSTTGHIFIYIVIDIIDIPIHQAHHLFTY